MWTAIRFITIVALCLCAAACSVLRGHQHSSPSPIPGADLTRGSAIYMRECAACHGARGTGGGMGPPLAGEHRKKTFAAVQTLVLDPAPPMPKLYPSRMTKGEVRDVSAYVESL